MPPMVAVVVTLCLRGHCVDEHRLQAVSPLACAGMGPELQEVAVDLARQYPGWSVRAMKCEDPKARHV